jgi:hypothetical protein
MYPRTAGNLKPVNWVLINEMTRAAESLGESGYRLAKCGILETTVNAVNN